MWKVMEMELSLMYDILYTKAAVIHTSIGYCIRVFTSVAIAASFLLFHFSGSKDLRNGVDVIVTYVLLGGALVMETTSLLSALGSSWALSFLCGTRWRWLQHVALCGGRWQRFRRVVVNLRWIYGERTWALRCGNTETIRRSLKKEPRTKCYSYIKDKPHQRSFETEADEEEFLVCCAHTLFHICKYAVVDDSSDDSAGDIQTRDTTLVGELNEEKLYVVMGIELSLMYDILYTKASVIHTWIGYFIRVASPVTITGSVIIFQFSGKYGQNIVDIAITYVLLTGALLLEVISLLRALGSSWTFPFLCAARWNWLKHAALCSGKWHWFRHKIVSLRHLFKVTGINRYCTPSRRLSGSIEQYNMLYFCTRHCTSYSPLLGWLAKLLGQDDWWETFHYSGTVKIPWEVKHDVFKYIKEIGRKDDVNTLGVIRKNWGEETLKLLSRKLVDSPSTYLGAELQEGIIIWHIATELFLTRCKMQESQGRRCSAHSGGYQGTIQLYDVPPSRPP
uniref:DUF4220 domain-containing protein n=1 Tax=Oryza barthii TaxID=65489 RepID=A0A0D3FSC5_9ORYZ